MTNNQAIDILTNSEKSDWLRFSENSTMTYKKDLNLRIKKEEATIENYSLTWHKFPNPITTGENYSIYYCNSLVYQVLLISVDETRAIIPLPITPTNLIVSKLDANLARIVDLYDDTDEYMKMTKYKIK